MTVYLATDLIKGEPKPMEDERIRCRWFTPREIDRMIRTGRLRRRQDHRGFLDLAAVRAHRWCARNRIPPVNILGHAAGIPLHTYLLATKSFSLFVQPLPDATLELQATKRNLGEENER